MTDNSRSIELVPLATVVANLRAPLVMAGTPVGMRLIFEVESGTVEGERLRGSIKGFSGADWFVMAPDGTSMIDVRMLIETHDGALVYVEYDGRVVDSVARTAPRFETGDERYKWLNAVQAVAKGTVDNSVITYDVYEVR
jgi:hypothetical protein